ncbi:MAG: iron export ABC transporter permease subunit FetB [Gammaproteobacteria bacterium]|nr:MAG: iron export ABC transporter permease subunit FetB [Gammaproteobacteria bacterium]
MIALTPFDLALAACLVLVLAGLSLALHLELAGPLLVAAGRAVAQLLLIGLVLKALFAHAEPGLIGLAALFMVLLAGREVMARQRIPFRGGWGYALGTISMFFSAFAVALLALLTLIRADPWYAPQYAIPLLGMLLGNTMNGIALGLDRLTQGAVAQRAVIEGRLMLGQRAGEAIADLRRESLRGALIPIINAMSAAGIISLPGMMTGQILAGAPPVEAVKYQVLILFLIAAGTGFGALAAVWMGARRLFDERERLRLERLRY